MRKIIVNTVLLAVTIASALSCNPASKTSKIQSAHNSQNSLDWDGIYRGTLPCADCQGIQTPIYLNKDQTYTIKTKYLGRENNEQETSGKFTWNKEGNIIQLENTGGSPGKYKVKEGALVHLDNEGKKITGANASNYLLTKGAYAIAERYWKLVELYGKPVTMDESFIKEPHIIFRDSSGRYNANGGCNGFSGKYEVSGYNRSRITPGPSTLMACKNMETEKQFQQVLKTAESYVVSGDELQLIKARMAPLAKFRSVLMK